MEMDITKWVVLIVFVGISVYFAFNCSRSKDTNKKET